MRPSMDDGHSLQLVSFGILLSDFEQTNYVWLPGGNWVVTGTAFGSSPAKGTLAGQNAVDGYLGTGLANSFNGGDASTGILTSPTFTIQRKYIKFLIGAGNWRGQTCLNLLVNGQIVRSSVGMGDREHLDWLQWNVSAYTNQTAQLQIVDNYTGGWGHINVDEITETEGPIAGTIVANQRYLNLPVSFNGTGHLIELVQEGLVAQEYNLNRMAWFITTGCIMSAFNIIPFNCRMAEIIVGVMWRARTWSIGRNSKKSSTLTGSDPVFRVVRQWM